MVFLSLLLAKYCSFVCLVFKKSFFPHFIICFLILLFYFDNIKIFNLTNPLIFPWMFQLSFLVFIKSMPPKQIEIHLSLSEILCACLLHLDF